MGETIGPAEVAHTVVHGHGPEHVGRREGLLEIGEAILLAIVAIATAAPDHFSGFIHLG